MLITLLGLFQRPPGSSLGLGVMTTVLLAVALLLFVIAVAAFIFKK